MFKFIDGSIYSDVVEKNSDFFSSHYFHSLIDLNLVKLDLILRYGILSEALIEEKGLINLYTYDKDEIESKNGNDFVSLSRYTNDCKFDSSFESFTRHALTSLTFLISNNIKISDFGSKMTYFNDELFVMNFIGKENIKGIMVPDSISNLPINKLRCLPQEWKCYTYEYINNWILCMESYFGVRIDKVEIDASLCQARKIFDSYDFPDCFIHKAIREQWYLYGRCLYNVMSDIMMKLWEDKLGVNNPKFMDVVLDINDDRLPVYEIKRDRIRKVR